MAWVVGLGGQPHFAVYKTVLFAGGFIQAVRVNALDNNIVAVLNLTAHFGQWKAYQDAAKTKMGPPGDAAWFERHGELMARQFGSEEIGVLVPWAPDTTVGMATQADKKSLLNFINTRFEKGEPVTTKGKRDVKKMAVKGIKGMKAKMVRDLVRSYRKDGVLDLMRSFYKGERKSGLGLTEKGQKLLKSPDSEDSTK